MRTILYPLIWILQIAYLSLTHVIGSYGIALILLSLITSLIMAWLGRLIKRYPEREALVHSLMLPKLKEIKTDSNPQDRHQKTVALYKKYNYHPILALRSAFPLFLQLPFLFAAYNMLNGLDVLQDVSFWLIGDLSAPDKLIAGINLLPILMTVVNVLTALNTQNFSTKEKVQALVIAGVFLVLLYNAASALLVYWTINNIIFFTRTIWSNRISLNSNSKKEHEYQALGVLSLITKQNLNRLLPYISVCFFGISLYYLIQMVADPDGRFFTRITKSFPFFVSSLLLQTTCLVRIIRGKAGKSELTGLVLFTANALIVLAYIISKFLCRVTFINSYSLVFSLLGFLSLLTSLVYLLCYPKLYTFNKHGIMSKIAILCLPVMIPGVHLMLYNLDYLSGYYIPLYIVTIVLFPICINLIAIILFSDWLHKSYLLIWSSIISFTIVIMPVLRSVFSLRSSKDIDFWFLSVLVGFISYLISRHNKQHRVIFLSVVIIASTGVGFILRQSNSKNTTESPIRFPGHLEGLSFKETPNIYLFVYDGMPNERVFRIDSLPFDDLKLILDKYSYKLYSDTYSLGSASLGSMAATLDIWVDDFRTASQAQDIYCGNSLVNKYLRSHGYSTNLLLENYYTGAYAVTNKKLVDEIFPPRSTTDVKSDYFITLIRGIFQGEMKFDTRGLMMPSEFDETARQARKHEIIRTSKAKSFTVDHFRKPGHSQNSGRCLPNENELWTAKYKLALQQMESDLKLLSICDKDAIVVLIGDHGPNLTGDCFNLEHYTLSEITADMIWDRIGTMIAIHWPDSVKASKYDSDLILNQDIFPVVFSYLVDNPAPLSLKPDRTFRGYKSLTRPEIVFREGKILN